MNDLQLKIDAKIAAIEQATYELKQLILEQKKLISEIKYTPIRS